MNDFLSAPYAGFVIALFVFVIGLAIVFVGRRAGAAATVSGYAVAGIGVLLVAGAGVFAVNQNAQMKSMPAPPGEIVDVGGFRMHVLCEGPEKNGPAVLWIPGGYGQGLHLYHLHKEMREERRSCLIDRAGTGWSDRSPSPRTTKNIVEEFNAALEAVGERGPHVVIGHSLGGIISVNYAARYPQKVAGLVALDPTPWALVNATGHGPHGWCRAPFPTMQVFGSMFGLGYLIPALNPLNNRDVAALYAPLEDVWEPMKAMEMRPRSLIASQEGFKEACLGGYDVMRTAGGLGDLPLLSIVQLPADEETALRNARTWQSIEDDVAIANWRRVVDAANAEYPNYSSKGVLQYAPAGAGHMFPLEEPAFTLQRIRSFLASLDNRSVE